MYFRFLACLLGIGVSLFPLSVTAAPNGPVIVVPIKTEISQAQFYFLRRALKEAERDGASAFIIEMDTYGGEVKAATSNMDALLRTRVPTFTYINSKAISAGALITLATNKIYMSPTAVIGAAAPVMGGGDDLPKTMTDKVVSSLSAMARAAASKNGHRPDLADAFISKEKEVKIGEVVIDKADTLLTLSAAEAIKVYDGKPLLAVDVADSIEEMIQKAGLTGSVRRIEPSGFEQAALYITTLAPFFFFGGLIGAYLEFKTPGFGLPGFVSAFCFAVFFTGHYLAGLAGWEVGAIFAIGLLLVLGELLLHPGTIIPGVVGILLMTGSLLWAMVDRYPGESWIPPFAALVGPLTNFGLALVLTIIAGIVLAKFLPRTSLYSRLVLGSSVGGSDPVAVPSSAGVLTVGQSGKALTMLRPSGKAEFAGQLLDVVTQGDFIDPGSSIRVVAVDGLRVVVEREG
jgi:membrane-bound serine protease (ClpP class)